MNKRKPTILIDIDSFISQNINLFADTNNKKAEIKNGFPSIEAEFRIVAEKQIINEMQNSKIKENLISNPFSTIAH